MTNVVIITGKKIHLKKFFLKKTFCQKKKKMEIFVSTNFMRHAYRKSPIFFKKMYFHITEYTIFLKEDNQHFTLQHHAYCSYNKNSFDVLKKFQDSLVDIKQQLQQQQHVTIYYSNHATEILLKHILRTIDFEENVFLEKIVDKPDDLSELYEYVKLAPGVHSHHIENCIFDNGSCVMKHASLLIRSYKIFREKIQALKEERERLLSIETDINMLYIGETNDPMEEEGGGGEENSEQQLEYTQEQQELDYDLYDYEPNINNKKHYL